MGQDPLEARRHAAASAARAMTFKASAEAYIADHEASWRNAKHKAQWSSTLVTYAHPVIGSLPVAAIDTALVLKIIRPLWASKTETARVSVGASRPSWIGRRLSTCAQARTQLSGAAS